MKKKIINGILILAFVTIAIIMTFNIYKAIVTGNQDIYITTNSKVYTNEDMYLSIIAEDDGEELETKSKIELLDIKGKKVKNLKVKFDNQNIIISIPDIKPGEYIITAKVKTKKGKDKIEKKIYVTDGKNENATITLDKGIYKPGDEVRFRTLVTNKENDKPIKEKVNIKIYDGNNNKVFSEEKETSDFGIVSGEFKLADEVNSGIYKLVVETNNNETTKQFKVNPYVLPKYDVKINFDKDNYLVNEKVQINLKAKYFFNEPVENVKYKVYINDKEIETINGDKEGNANLYYKIMEPNQYNVKVEATDSSNYYVEAQNSFIAKTDKFKIELLPEFGNLVNGRKNNVYVFTTDFAGNSVETYVTISSNKFTKQIATDENGIGKFSIDIDKNDLEYNNSNKYKNSSKKNTYDNYYENYKIFSVSAVNMNNEKVDKKIKLKIEDKSLVLLTDKVKYNQNEDIKLKIDSLNEMTKNICFLKNNKIIKMVSTDSNEVNVNLGDIYGLIDIYIIDGKQTVYSNNKNDIKYKKTIFIKPSQKLGIEIKTNKQEYKPGENMTISFGTKDENNNVVDSALLVSMIDNSVLKLQNNDLSIDNIKMALSDIEFSNELDAATLYSCIVNDKSEQIMMALLLKQKDDNPEISKEKVSNFDEEEKAKGIAIFLGIVLSIMLVIYLCIKFEKIREIIKHVLNALLFIYILEMTTEAIIDEIFYNIENSMGLFILTAVIGLIIYILGLSRIEKEISKTTISLIVLSIVILFSMLIIGFLEEKIIWVIIVLALLILILSILIIVNEHKKLKIDKFLRKISKQLIYIDKFIASILVSISIAVIVANLIGIEMIIIPTSMVITYIVNYIFNKIGKEKNNSEKTKKVENVFNIFCITFTILGIIGFWIVNIVTITENNIMSSTSIDINGIESSNNISEFCESDATDKKSSSSFSGIIEGVKDFLDNGKDNNKEQEVIQKEEKNKAVDNQIRNMFLESMCFVPELVTENGNAKLDLELADNITTWTIQTVGNTKDGKIGYNKLDDIKVFKEFFVDFELPRNLKVQDKVSIPVTVYNYTKDTLKVDLKVKVEDWFKIENNDISIKIEPETNKMIYIPITVLKHGNYKFTVEAKANELKDIIEKNIKIEPNGMKIEKVVSTGRLGDNIEEDILLLDEIIKDTASAKVKIYGNNISQVVEGMNNIFRMPTGCFEQVSSSLYPDILALKYLKDNEISNKKIEEKALEYISKGYQKLLTFEVKGEKGGYSLFGNNPAETVLTSYGLMQLTDLQEVYNVDDNVIENMKEFLYKNQNLNGSFKLLGISSHYVVGSREDLASNAYIIWTLSESDEKDKRLEKSIKYLKDKIDKVEDNYTLALIANALANVKDKEVNKVITKLVNNVINNGDEAYIESKITDYYGSYGKNQRIQTTALLSNVLSKTEKNMNLNKLLINYIIKSKDKNGTWNSTQATVLALKALNLANKNEKLDKQTIKVKLNDDEQKIEIKEDSMDFYEIEFKNLSKENKLTINSEKGNAYYEVIEEYYIPYDVINLKENKMEISVNTNNDLKVNDILDADIKIINRAKQNINNAMVTIDIPQGFIVDETSLSKLVISKAIEKYEMNYNKLHIYLRNFENRQIKNLKIKFRAMYPVEINGLSIRAYDYYNPEIESKTLPIKLIVK